MSFTVKNFAVAALLTATLAHAQGSSGSGKTTRYWDCCKPSCAWPSDSVTSPVKVCDAKDQPLSDVNAQSGCQGGPAYMCSDQTPWAISSDLAYGFAAVSGASPKCCACYELTFTSTALAGKKMIVQATNTGGDVGASQFDLAVCFLPTRLLVIARWSKNCILTLSGYRFQAVASVFSTLAQPNGAPRQTSGAPSTVAQAPTHVLDSRKPSRQVADSAGTGCKALAIPSKFLSRLFCFNP